MFRLSWIVFFFCCSTLASDANIAIYQDVHEDYQCFLNGRKVEDINDYSGQCQRKDVVEAVLIQQLLIAGDFAHAIKLQPHQAITKSKHQLVNGEILLTMETYWRDEVLSLRKHVFISPPLIRSKEYIAGVYTSPNNQRALAAKSKTDLKALSFISNKNWDADWQFLTRLDPLRLENEASWLNQFDAVAKQAIDVMLCPFNNVTEDMSYTENGLTLIPIPNIKVNLQQSRHILISKKHPLGKQAIKALQSGFKHFRAQGRIKKAYQQAGFFHPKVAQWQMVN